MTDEYEDIPIAELALEVPLQIICEYLPYHIIILYV